MADRFWVGGSGNWDATSTANWSDVSGGSAGASAPTSADDVYFDAASNVGTGAFTVTVTGTSAAPAACRSFTTGGTGGALDGAMTLTMGATAQLDCFGSMTLPATNLSISGTTGALVRFRATTAQTLTTNGVSLGNVSITVDGVAGTLTLGSALTCSTITVTNGAFNTSASNYNVTAVALSSSNSNTRSITLNGSTVTLSGASVITFTTATGLTFNAGTSSISCSNFSPTLAGGGQTFYNVSFTSINNASLIIVSGANTFNDFSVTSINSTGSKFISLTANQTVNGTLTLGAANTAIRRIRIQSGSAGVQRVITLNGTLATLSDVDFRDIGAAGTSAPWTGTRLGDCKNTSGITFDAPKTVYWNLSGTQNWSATGWALTNNGTPAVNNFPLAQDTATFTEAGAAGTVTYDQTWSIGSIQMADGVSNRTTAFTLATGTNTPSIYGSVTLFSNLSFTGTGVFTFLGQGITQTFTSAGLTLTQPITINSINGTFQLQDNLTLGSSLTFTLTSGTLNLNGNTLSTGTLSSSGSTARAIAFGSGGSLIVTGSGTAFNAATGTNLTTSGTGTINMTSASAKTFTGGGRSYPTLNQGGAGALTIAQSNTFANITNSTQPATITLTAGTTQTVNAFSLSGTAGNQITLDTTVAGTLATLNGTTGIVNARYVNIKDIRAQGYTEWNALVDQGAVDQGNNPGWNFITLGVKKILRRVFGRQIIRPVIEEI